MMKECKGKNDRVNPSEISRVPIHAQRAHSQRNVAAATIQSQIFKPDRNICRNRVIDVRRFEWLWEYAETYVCEILGNYAVVCIDN